MAFPGQKMLYKNKKEEREYTEQVFGSRAFQNMGERMNYSVSGFGTNACLFGIYT